MKKSLNAVVVALLLIGAGSACAGDGAVPVFPHPEMASLNVSKCAKPEYPLESARNNKQGTVIVRFLVSAEGKVVRAEIERSSGDFYLDKATVAILSACDQFRPGRVDGKPTESWARVAYEWKIE